MKLTAKLQPLTYEFPFVVSSFAKSNTTTIIITLSFIHNGNTISGIGEAVPVRLYNDSPEAVLQFYERLIQDKVLDNLSPFDIPALQERFKLYAGNMAAKAAIDMAFYDMQGKILNQPLWQIFGLEPAKCPESSYTIGMADINTVKHKTAIALQRGYSILKVKMGSEADISCFKAIRQLAPDCTIRVDANAAWTYEKAVQICHFLAEHRVELVEEPLRLDSSEADYTLLKKNSPLPLMADERCHTSKDLMFCAKYYNAINLKPCKTGGLTEAMVMIEKASTLGLDVMLGGFGETSVSVTAFAHLAPKVRYCDLDAALLIADDPYTGIVFNGSKFTLPNRAGLGVVKKSQSTQGAKN
ncbi:MAG: dipeptide epimerase [Cyanobacteria bacterium P01_H01_bin.74]